MKLYYKIQITEKTVPLSKCSKICGTESQKWGGDDLLVEKEVLDTVRKEEAGGSVEATPSQTSTYTEPTEL